MTILRTTFASFVTGMLGGALLLTALLFTRPREVKIILPPTVHHSTRVVAQTEEMEILLSGDYLLVVGVDGSICVGDISGPKYAVPCRISIPARVPRELLGTGTSDTNEGGGEG